MCGGTIDHADIASAGAVGKARAVGSAADEQCAKKIGEGGDNSEDKHDQYADEDGRDGQQNERHRDDQRGRDDGRERHPPWLSHGECEKWALLKNTESAGVSFVLLLPHSMTR